MNESKKYSVKELAEANGVTGACIYGIIKRLAILPPEAYHIRLDEVQAARVAGAIRRPKQKADNV